MSYKVRFFKAHRKYPHMPRILTKDDCRLSAWDSIKELRKLFVDDEMKQLYFDMVFIGGDDKELARTLHDIAEATNIKPTPDNIEKLKVKLISTSSRKDRKINIVDYIGKDFKMLPYFKRILEKNDDNEMVKALNYIAKARNLKPTQRRLRWLKADLLQDLKEEGLL